jgi:hypothetical protein
MSTDNPKALLSKLEKEIAAAKDTFAELERIERLRAQLETEQKSILNEGDPEDREAVKRAGDIYVQLQMLPRRVERALEKQAPAVQAVLDTSDEVEKVISRLAGEEIESLLDEMEPVFRKWNPEYRNGNGELQKPARTVAGHSTIFGHIGARCTVAGRDSALSFRCGALQHNPKSALSAIQRYAEGQIIVLSEYFANGKSFVAPGFRKGAE